MCWGFTLCAFHTCQGLMTFRMTIQLLQEGQATGAGLSTGPLSAGIALCQDRTVWRAGQQKEMGPTTAGPGNYTSLTHMASGNEWSTSALDPVDLILLLVSQLCLTLCDMDSTPPGSSVHEILQARRLEWVTIPFFRRNSWPRDWTWVSCIAGRFFTIWTTREAHYVY